MNWTPTVRDAVEISGPNTAGSTEHVGKVSTVLQSYGRQPPNNEIHYSLTGCPGTYPQSSLKHPSADPERGKGWSVTKELNELRRQNYAMRESLQQSELAFSAGEPERARRIVGNALNQLPEESA